MSATRGPVIVKDRLVLYLDATDINSYSGSNTIWKDLSGNGNTATMYGTVPFTSSNLNYFDFATASGSYSYNVNMGFTFSRNMIPTTGNFTLCSWIKSPSSGLSQVGLFSNAAGASGFRFGIGGDGIYWLIGPDYAEGSVLFSSALSSLFWYNVVAVYARAEATPQVRLYLNGILQGSSNFPATQTAFSDTAPGLVRSSCCSVYKGLLAQFSAYSKALTPTEILNNYNALKGRFLL